MRTEAWTVQADPTVTARSQAWWMLRAALYSGAAALVLVALVQVGAIR
jgi:hypothetical protein